ncbi:MAG: organoarsenical effux MFS transporter ArsJ [Magnetococcales bacterium]|nr:organoarsenical effux MFS transporter ArsJ [Magnetococcales bacterium]NGZ25750.1 organoarsenical effux MFS transporter ArsJ [Magnetococcales bacterium]
MTTAESPAMGLRLYLIITLAYWAFTLTDGAIHMLVVLHFHQLGYSPISIAFLFLFYEVFGIITNGVGGWIATRIGLNRTMIIGGFLQVFALGMLAMDPSWLTVTYVMTAMAFSGIAKDLNKMSAKAGVKLVTPKGEDAEGRLFKWVAILTGSKNTLKGAGFFLGGLLLQVLGFQTTLMAMAGVLWVVYLITMMVLPSSMGVSKSKAKISQIFSKSREINVLSAARFFLFGSRDVWFVVGLPVFLQSVVGWNHVEVGSFLALWVVCYGFVQAGAPLLFRNHPASGTTARKAAFLLAAIPAAIAASLYHGYDPAVTLMAGLAAFGVVFAINSSLHSYLILSYSDNDKVALNVGFYYSANAAGRLVGTLLSGWVYQTQGLMGCLWWSCGFVMAAALLSMMLPGPAQVEQKNFS